MHGWQGRGILGLKDPHPHLKTYSSFGHPRVPGSTIGTGWAVYSFREKRRLPKPPDPLAASRPRSQALARAKRNRAVGALGSKPAPLPTAITDEAGDLRGPLPWPDENHPSLSPVCGSPQPSAVNPWRGSPFARAPVTAAAGPSGWRHRGWSPTNQGDRTWPPSQISS